MYPGMHGASEGSKTPPRHLAQHTPHSLPHVRHTGRTPHEQHVRACVRPRFACSLASTNVCKIEGLGWGWEPASMHGGLGIGVGV